MRNLTEFEKGQTVWQHLTHQNSWTARHFLLSVTISRTVTEFKNTENPPTTGVIPDKLTDRDRRALKRIVEESIGVLPPKWLLSWINIWIVRFRSKLFTVSSLKPDIVEEPPSGNLCFPLSTFRRGWQGLVQFFSFPNYMVELMCGGSPAMLTTLTTFFQQWSTVMVWADIPWNFLGPVVALHGSINNKDHLYTCSPNGAGNIPWWWRHLLRRQCSATFCPCDQGLVWRAWKWARTNRAATAISRSQYCWAFVVRLWAIR